MKRDKKPSIFLILLRRTYMMYAAITFIVTFLFVLPAFFVADIFKKDKAGLLINHYWAHVYFFIIGLPIDISNLDKLDKKANYIFCPNHFSYLDIGILPFIPFPFMFVGKLSISKVPFFGYMFKRFHITVDRTKMREKYATYARSITALKNGFSLAVFPEGGIRSNGTIQMGTFKEGPFRMAIEANTPLVPVTMLDNWHIFPDDGRFNFFRRKCRMIVHDPISPSKYTMDQIKEFQEEVFTKIQTALNQNHQPV